MEASELTEVNNAVADQKSAIAAQSKILRRLDAKVDSLTSDVGRIQPRSHLPPIRKPMQGIDYVRSFNVAGYLDDEIKRKNSEKIGAKYLEFESDASNETLNGDAMRCLEGLFHTYLPNVYGTCTWKEACQKEKVLCERVIREAALNPELAVFSQGAYWWPLPELAKQKFKSKLRVVKKRTNRDSLAEARSSPQTDYTGHHGLVNSRVVVIPEENPDSNRALTYHSSAQAFYDRNVVPQIQRASQMTNVRPAANNHVLPTLVQSHHETPTSENVYLTNAVEGELNCSNWH